MVFCERIHLFVFKFVTNQRVKPSPEKIQWSEKIRENREDEKKKTKN